MTKLFFDNLVIFTFRQINKNMLTYLYTSRKDIKHLLWRWLHEGVKNNDSRSGN